MEEFRVNISQTGSSFWFGRVFRPTRAEVLYALHKFYEGEVDPKFNLVDFEACCDPLLGMRYIKKWSKKITWVLDVEFVVEPDTIDEQTKEKVYGEQYWVWNSELEPAYMAGVWVLMCYSYFYDTSPTRSPRPGLHKKAVKGMGRVKTKGSYYCPHCGKAFRPIRVKDDSDRYIDFIVWLAKHAEDYHRYGQFGPRLHQALKAGQVEEEVTVIDLFGKPAPSKAEIRDARLQAMSEYVKTGNTNVDQRNQPTSEVKPLPTLERKETQNVTDFPEIPVGPASERLYPATPPQPESEGAGQVRAVYQRLLGNGPNSTPEEEV